MKLRVWWFLVSWFTFLSIASQRLGRLGLPFVNEQADDLALHLARP